jgi:hypothetical protein
VESQQQHLLFLQVRSTSKIQVFCHAEARNYARYFGVEESKSVWIPYCTDVSCGPLTMCCPFFTSGSHQRNYATLFEAVAELPVEVRVASSASNCEACGETDYLVNPADPAALREQILELLAHPGSPNRIIGQMFSP